MMISEIHIHKILFLKMILQAASRMAAQIIMMPEGKAKISKASFDCSPLKYSLILMIIR